MDQSWAWAAAAGCLLAIGLGTAFPSGTIQETPAAVTSPPVVTQAPPDPDPSLRHAVRLVGAYAGEGVLTCPLGAAMADGPVQGLRRAVVRHGVLTAMVSEAEGYALLRSGSSSGPPHVIVRWEGAWAGEEGECQVLEPRLMPVEGWVVHRDGSRTFDGEVGGELGIWPIALDGSFAARCWYGVPCRLAVRPKVGAAWGPVEELVPDGPMYGVELVMDRPRREPSVVEAVAEQVQHDADAERMADPLLVALEDPSLPKVGRDLVLAWQAEETHVRLSTAGLLEASYRGPSRYIWTSASSSMPLTR